MNGFKRPARSCESVLRGCTSNGPMEVSDIFLNVYLYFF